MKKPLILLIALLCIRLISLGLYPLFDETEGRYAGIAIRMALSGDFLTPWFLPGELFLAKPPLSFWATALCFKFFGGFNEFLARLPHFLAMLAALWLGYEWTKKISGAQKASTF